MRESLELMSAGAINPAAMITHIGGLTAARETTLQLHQIPGGKKLIYTHFDFPLVALSDLNGRPEPFFRELGACCDRYDKLWNVEAEQYLLAHGPRYAP